MNARMKARMRGVTAAMVVAGLLTLAGPAWAELPTGERFRQGRPEISREGRTMTITRTANADMIDWDTFNIGKDHVVRIRQPSAEAFIVNRVTGSAASQIDGSLEANGRVYLVNPNGISFGRTAQVAVGGLIAVAGHVDDDALASGRSIGIESSAVVRHEGGIRVRGGDLTLAGLRVVQDGKIEAKAGSVHLIGAEKMKLLPNGKLTESYPREQSGHVEHGGEIDSAWVHIDANGADASIVMSPKSRIGATGGALFARYDADERAAPPITLANVRAPKLVVDTQVHARWKAESKDFDGSAATRAEGPVTHSGLKLAEGSNLTLSKSFRFADAEPGENKRVSGILHLKGFSGEETLDFPMTGASTAAILRPYLPGGLTKRSGEVEVRHEEKRLVVTQRSTAAKVDWETFRIGSGHAVTFEQPDQRAFIVNRVTGAAASRIDGALSANGRVYLINPNGITFGTTATVDASGLVAAAMKLSDEQMLGDASPVSLMASSRSTMINSGEIRIRNGGVATLVGDFYVEQGGVIEAPNGSVDVMAGAEARLSQDGQVLAAVGTSNDSRSSHLNGKTRAPGGRVGARGSAVYLGGELDFSDGGALFVDSRNIVELSGDLRAGKSVQIQAPLLSLADGESHNRIPTQMLQSWLDAGAQVRLSTSAALNVDAAIDATGTATAGLDLEVDRGDIHVSRNISFGQGDIALRAVSGRIVMAEGSEIRTGHGKVRFATASLAQALDVPSLVVARVQASELHIDSPVFASFSAKDRDFDGTREASVEREVVQGLALQPGSNLEIGGAYTFGDPQTGVDKAVTGVLRVKGFSAERVVDVPMQGMSSATIRPSPPPEPVPPPQPKPQPQPQPQPEISPEPVVPTQPVVPPRPVIPLEPVAPPQPVVPPAPINPPAVVPPPTPLTPPATTSASALTPTPKSAPKARLPIAARKAIACAQDRVACEGEIGQPRPQLPTASAPQFRGIRLPPGVVPAQPGR